MTNPTYPVPEFIRGTKGTGWRINQSGMHGPRMKPGILEVPLDNECVLCGQNHSLAIRNHELTHAEITLDKHGRMPAIPPGLKNEYFQAVEDNRIWAHIHQALDNEFGEHYHFVRADDGTYLKDEDGNVLVEYDNPPALCPKEREKWEGVFARLDDKNRVLFATAAGEADQNFINSIVRNATPPEAKLNADTVLEIAANAQGIVASNPSDIRSTYRAAAMLQRLLEPPTGDEEKEPDPDEGSDPSDGDFADKREERGDGPELRPMAAEEKPKVKHEHRYRPPDEGSAGWCKVEMQTPSLGRQMDGRLISVYRAKEEGSFIRSPHRLYQDGKIFGVKRRVPGGGVLIDDSGSMGLGLDEILTIMTACPGATIGVYSSDGGGTGYLRIVARDGRVIDNDEQAHTPGGGNGIDGPALRWLASLPFPRKVWISDECATGNGDVSGRSLRLECQVICKQHGIQVVNPHVIPRDKLAEAAANVLLGKQMLAGRSH